MLHHLLELLGLQQPESQSLPAPQLEPQVQPEPQPQQQPEPEPIAVSTPPTAPDPIQLPRSVQRLVEQISSAFDRTNYANLKQDYQHKLAQKLIKKLLDVLPPLYLKVLKKLPQATHDERHYLDHFIESLQLSITPAQLEQILDDLEEAGLFTVQWKPELFNPDQLCYRWELTPVGTAVVRLSAPDQVVPDPPADWVLPPHSLDESVFDYLNTEAGQLVMMGELTESPFPIELPRLFNRQIPCPPPSAAPHYQEMLPSNEEIKQLIHQMNAISRKLEPLTQRMQMQGVDLRNAWKYLCLQYAYRNLQLVLHQLYDSTDIPPVGDPDHHPWTTYQWRVLHEAQSLVRQQSPFHPIEEPPN